LTIRQYVIIGLLAILPFAYGQTSEQTSRKVLKLMGTRFEIIAVHPDVQHRWDAINAGIAEITRIEKLISSWDPNSQTSEINRQAGQNWVATDAELIGLIERSIKVSALTDGAFDISFASIDHIWKFDGSVQQMPPAKAIKQSVAKINYQNILIDKTNQRVKLKDKGMKIGFGAIGKGYAANKAKDIMQKMGIESGVVNASGDLIAWGKDENNEPWKIGITDPNDKNKAYSWLYVNNMAVVTSGNYEKHIDIEGTRYSHIIHPHTGMPVTGTKSVTIICPDAELADALATAVFTMGPGQGMQLVNRLKNVECMIIDEKDEAHYSKKMKTHIVKGEE
jgi:thiamine biosynthesis lipoprotein